MTLMERLRKESDNEMEKLSKFPLVEKLLTGDISRERYQEFLNDIYHVVWHFCPTMAAAAARCDESLAAARYFYYEHIEEEKTHEIWVLEDCEAVGGKSFADAVRNGRPCDDVQGMVGFNYWVTEHEHPYGAMGMVYALEVISSRIAGRAGAGVAKALGLQLDPPVGVKFLATHGPLDADHLLELEDVLGGVTDDKVADTIVNATRVNFRLFSATFR